MNKRGSSIAKSILAVALLGGLVGMSSLLVKAPDGPPKPPAPINLEAARAYTMGGSMGGTVAKKVPTLRFCARCGSGPMTGDALEKYKAAVAANQKRHKRAADEEWTSAYFSLRSPGKAGIRQVATRAPYLANISAGKTTE